MNAIMIRKRLINPKMYIKEVTELRVYFKNIDIYTNKACHMGQKNQSVLRFLYNNEVKVNESENVKLLSHVQLLETPQIVAHQAPLSMEFSRQE